MNINNFQISEGVTRGGGHHGRGPVLVSRRKGHGAAERQDPEAGQALVTLLIFLMMGLAIATAASFLIASNSSGATNVQEGVIARQMADSGVEEAYLKILRNNYTYTGETINNLDGGSVTVGVTWNGITATIVSTATNGNFIKKVESVVTYDNNGLTQISWKEVN